MKAVVSAFSRSSFGAMSLVLIAFAPLGWGQPAPFAAAVSAETRSDRAERVRQLNDQVLGIHALLQEAGPDGAADLHSQARETLRARAAELSALIPEDPKRALSLAFSLELLADLSAKFPDSASFLETQGTWQGQIEISIVDYPDGSFKSIRQVNVGEEMLELHFAGPERAGLKTGDVVSATGVRLGSSVVAAEATILPPAIDQATTSAESISQPCSPTGAQSTAVLLGGPVGVTPPVTAQAVQDVFFGTATGHSLDGYWKEASYGQTSATGSVFGWYSLAGSYSCSTLSQMFNDTMSAAIAAGVNLANYSRIFFLFPSLSCGWSGWSQVGGCSLTTPGGTLPASWSYIVANVLSTRDDGVSLVAHEGGHQMGLNHASTLSYGTQPLGAVGSAGTVSEFGDWWSVLGANTLGLYSAPHRAMLGWMTSGSSYQVVQTSGTYTLQPIEISPPGLQALKVERGTGNSSYWLWLEYRQPLGSYDSTLPNAFSQAFSGALIHYEDSTTAPHTQLIDFTSGDTNFYYPALAAGASWVDPYTNLSISVQSATSNGLTVAVNYGAASCTTANPTVSASPLDPSTSAGTNVSYSVSVTNNDSAACSSSTFSLNSSQPSGWATTFSSSALVLSPGQNGTATMTKTVPSGTAPGTLAVNASAANGAFVGTATANVTVLAPPPLSASLSVSGATYTRGQTVSFTATVLDGTTPAAGASVTFKMTKADGSTATKTVTTGSTGNAVWSYKVGAKDPKGNYSVVANATYNSQSAVSLPVSFTVQ